MTHSLARWRSDASYVCYNRFGDIGFDKCSRFFFCSATNFTNHNNGLCLIIALKHTQDVDKVRTWNWVAPNANTRRLTKTMVSSLFNGFIGQSSGTRNDSYFTRQMDMSGHNANLALAGCYNSGAIWSD